jgi:hypothetical protein
MEKCVHVMGLCSGDALEFYKKYGFVYCGKCGEKFNPTTATKK